MWERTEWLTQWSHGGIELARVRYHAERYSWGPTVLGGIDAVVLMRNGAFRRRADGVDHVVDPHTGYFRRRGEEVSVANFTGEPEEFSVIRVAPSLLGELFAEPRLPGGPVTVIPEIDLMHRMLQISVARDADDAEIEERVLGLVASVVAQRRASVVRGARRTTEPNWRSLVGDACEVLHTSNGDMSVQELARRVGCSPFHLSRVFRAVTGSTISQYRMRLRVRAVLDRLSQGEDDLSSLANAVGFFDHSHMTRCVVAQVGEPPSVLRRLLRASG